MSDIYKFAAKNALRFPSSKGDLTVEQLFQLPLKSPMGTFDLNSVAKAISRTLKGATEESFVEDTSNDPSAIRLSTAMEIVKDVIATKQAENKASLDRVKKTAERKKILDAIAAKKDEKLTQASLEELEKQLSALDD